MSTLEPSASPGAGGSADGVPDPETVARSVQAARALVQEAASVLAGLLPGDDVAGFGLGIASPSGLEPLGGLSAQVFSRFTPPNSLASSDVHNDSGCNGSCNPPPPPPPSGRLL